MDGKPPDRAAARRAPGGAGVAAPRPVAYRALAAGAARATPGRSRADLSRGAQLVDGPRRRPPPPSSAPTSCRDGWPIPNADPSDRAVQLPHHDERYGGQAARRAHSSSRPGSARPPTRWTGTARSATLEAPRSVGASPARHIPPPFDPDRDPVRYAGRVFGEEPGIACRYYAAVTCIMQADAAAAERHLAAGMAIARAIKQPFAVAEMLWSHCVVAHECGDAPLLERWALEILSTCEEGGIEGLFRSDHYQSVFEIPGRGSLDAWATLAGLAAVLRDGATSPCSKAHYMLALYAEICMKHGGRARARPWGSVGARAQDRRMLVRGGTASAARRTGVAVGFVGKVGKSGGIDLLPSGGTRRAAPRRAPARAARAGQSRRRARGARQACGGRPHPRASAPNLRAQHEAARRDRGSDDLRPLA